MKKKLKLETLQTYMCASLNGGVSGRCKLFSETNAVTSTLEEIIINMLEKSIAKMLSASNGNNDIVNTEDDDEVKNKKRSLPFETLNYGKRKRALPFDTLNFGKKRSLPFARKRFGFEYGSKRGASSSFIDIPIDGYIMGKRGE